jgi:hypothetical protein
MESTVSLNEGQDPSLAYLGAARISNATVRSHSPGVVSRLDATTRRKVESAIVRFKGWLREFGETSYDFQTVYAGSWGRTAKALYYRRPLLGTIAVAPMVFCEAFVPSARRYFFVRQRFPIADAHYAMAFGLLFQARGQTEDYQRAVHFLEVLLATRCEGRSDHSWGYPFDWVTLTGTIKSGTPLITSEPYVYEAFAQIYASDRNAHWLDVMRSLAEHVYRDYRDFETSPTAASCAYAPLATDRGLIVNASAYRAFLLTHAGITFHNSSYLERAERNVSFVVESQNGDGSWPYAVDGKRHFVDHIHTCFVLKALAKIEQLTGSSKCRNAIDRGLSYYTAHLFDEGGLPRPFSRAPRLTIYSRELYDYAECLNLATLLAGRSSQLDRLLVSALEDLVDRWQKPDGSFRSRKLMIGWDDVPMHRWAQAQLFRSLCSLLPESPVRTN